MPSEKYIVNAAHLGALQLRRQMADVLSLVDMPASWQSAQPTDIAGALVRVLVQRIRLDVAAVRLEGGAIAIRDPASVDWDALEAASADGDGVATLELPRPNSVGATTARLVSLQPLGEAGGRVYAASWRHDFPTDHERLLIRVASDQAALAIQSSRFMIAERSARVGAEKRQRRAAFLADATALLTESFDYEAALPRVIDLARGRICDASLLHVHRGGGSRIASASGADHMLVECLRGMRPQSAELLSKEAVLRRAGAIATPVERVAGTTIVAPIRIRGIVEGAFAIVSNGARHVYTHEDVELVDEIARRIGLAIDNAILYREAREADRRKDEFLAILGHELRNPLAPIATALQMMEMKGPGVFKKEHEVMHRQVDHLIRLVDDLLDVSRITRGKVHLELAPVSVAAILEKAVETTHPLVELKGHRLEVVGAESDLQVIADAARLSQVVSNLLNNAAKYTPAGGRIVLSAAADGDDLEIRVRDSGHGIDPSLLPRLFEIFVQDRRTIDRSEGGLGIGLAVVQSLVHLHGGTVRVESEGVGKGSEFIVRIPLRNANAVAASPARIPGKTRSTPRRVLVVDDNRDAATLLGELLRSRGHEVHLVHDGFDAIDAAAAKRPDAILLDIGLPGLDGYEVARRLRKIRELENVLLIAVTGYGQEKDRELATEAGFDEHLVKPLDVERLDSLLGAAAVPRTASGRA